MPTYRQKDGIEFRKLYFSEEYGEYSVTYKCGNCSTKQKYAYKQKIISLQTIPDEQCRKCKCVVEMIRVNISK